jgi:hypothetical protein
MKQIFTFLAFFQTFTSFGQIDANAEIQKDFSQYYAFIAEKRIDEALNYTNPKIFEFVPRDQFKSAMEEVYKMPNIEYKTGMPVYLKFDNRVKIENVNYVKFYIVSPIEMKFTDIKNTDKQVKEMVTIFEAKFGDGNVQFDKETGFYKIHAQKVIIANSDNNLDWTFVTVDNPKMKALLEKFIPVELLND